MSICKLHIKTAPLVGGGRGAEPAALTRRATAALCLEPAVGGRSSCTHSTVPASLPPPHGTEKSPPHPLPLPGIKQKYLLRRWAHASGSVGGPPQCQWGSSGAGSGAAAVGLSQEVVRTVQKGHNSERSVSNHLTAPSPVPQIGTGMRAGGGEGKAGGVGIPPWGCIPLRASVKCCRLWVGGCRTPPGSAMLSSACSPPRGLYCFGDVGGCTPTPPIWHHYAQGEAGTASTHPQRSAMRRGAMLPQLPPSPTHIEEDKERAEPSR